MVNTSKLIRESVDHRWLFTSDLLCILFAFLLLYFHGFLVTVIMSDIFDDLMLKVDDAAPAGPSTQVRVSSMRGTPMAGGVVNLEEVRLADYKGNKGLYYSYEQLGAKVCGCIIWTKNENKNFCPSLLAERTNSALVTATPQQQTTGLRVSMMRRMTR